MLPNEFKRRVAVAKENSSVADFVMGVYFDEEDRVRLIQRLYLNGHIETFVYDRMSELKWKKSD